MSDADRIMMAMGFGCHERGHYIDELRDYVRDEIKTEKRLNRGFPGWWSPPSSNMFGPISNDMRAHYVLHQDWEIMHATRGFHINEGWPKFIYQCEMSIANMRHRFKRIWIKNPYPPLPRILPL